MKHNSEVWQGRFEVGVLRETARLALLRCVAWTDGDGTSRDGYSCWDYWRDRGDGWSVYLGADAHGIEPIWEEPDDDRGWPPAPPEMQDD